MTDTEKILDEIKEDFNDGGYQDYSKWEINIGWLIKTLQIVSKQNKIMREVLERMFTDGWAEPSIQHFEMAGKCLNAVDELEKEKV